MKFVLSTCTILLCTCCAIAAAEVSVYAAGESVAGLRMKDQQGTEHSFKSGDARFILFETPAESGPSQSPQDPEWFKKNRALVVVNLSEFSGLKRRAAVSRIEAKPFRVCVIDDAAVAARFPNQSGKFTVLQLDEDGKIVVVRFVAPGKELKETVEANNR